MHWQHLFVVSIQRCILGLWRAVGRERGPPSHRFYPVGGEGGAAPCPPVGGRGSLRGVRLVVGVLWFVRRCCGSSASYLLERWWCDGASKKQRSSDTAIHDSAVCVCMCVRQDLISICLLLTKRFLKWWLDTKTVESPFLYGKQLANSTIRNVKDTLVFASSPPLSHPSPHLVSHTFYLYNLLFIYFPYLSSILVDTSAVCRPVSSGFCLPRGCYQ